MPGVHKGGTLRRGLVYVARPVVGGNASVFTRQMIHMRSAILCKASAGAICSNGSEPLDAFKCKSALGRHRLSTVTCAVIQCLRHTRCEYRFANAHKPIMNTRKGRINSASRGGICY